MSNLPKDLKSFSTTKSFCLSKGCREASFTVGKLYGELFSHLECTSCGIDRELTIEEREIVMNKTHEFLVTNKPTV